MKRKVIVTGGAGYIGSHTAVLLGQNHFEPIIVDDFSRSERGVPERIGQILGSAPKVYTVDCRDQGAFVDVLRRERDVYGVIHFAAFKAVGESVKKPLMYYDNNVGSLVSVLGAMSEAGVERFVFSSSCTVYGQPDQLPVTETSPRKPAESPYGRSKQFCEDIIVDQVRAGAELRAVTLRYFNPVGAHESALIGELPIGAPANLVPFITQTAVGQRDQLTIFGDDYDTPDGTCVRDYIHVMDLAEAHVRALEWLDGAKPGPLNEIFNVGTGKGHSVLEAVRTFEEVTGRKLNYRVGPRRPGDVEQTYADVSKVTEALRWRATRGLGDALRDAFRWQERI